mgnify:CR=1 FL=1
MKTLFRFILIYFMLVFSSISVYASEQAEFSIFLFQKGSPISEAELLVDGKPFARFSENGSVFGTLTSGNYQFTINHQDKSFGFALPLRPQENAQVMLTFPDVKGQPTLTIESNISSDAKTDNNTVPTKQKDLGEGTITGTVISAETSKPVSDVQIFLSGLNKRYKTNAQGQFKAKVPASEYSISLLHSAFNTQTKDKVTVTKDQTTTLTFKLTPSGVELAEYVVLEPFLAGTLASVIEEQRSSSSVSTVMGSEQISRNGDSDVASALKRASGLTVIGGKFVFIRGLGERYSTTLINGAAIPSPDPTRRVVPLDLFPTTFIDSVLVQKSYSVDRPGEFAGGTLEMRTKRVPDEFFVKFGAQIGFNEGTSFAKGLRYDGGDTDFLSYDDGTRSLAPSVAAKTADGSTLQPQTPFNPSGSTPQELQDFGQDLSGVWDVKPKTIGPDGRIEAAIGDSFDVGDFRLGYTSAVRWSQEWNNQDEVRREFSSSGRDGKGALAMTQDFDLQRTLREAQLNGYLALETQYKDNHRFFTNTMFLRQAIDEARVQQGFTDAEVNDVRRTQLKFITNQLFMQQVGGDHLFEDLNNLKIDWVYTNSTANRTEPNTRDYRYDENDDGSYSFSRRADSNQISFGELEDKDASWRMDVKLPIEFDNGFGVSLNSGFIHQEKNRESAIQRFTFIPVGPDGRDSEVLAQSSLEDILNPTFITPNGFQVRDTTRSTDRYNAHQELLSYYGQLDMNFFDAVRVTGGLRWEENDQFVETFKATGNSSESVVTSVKKTDMLPAVSATWFINKKQQLRIGFSQTISRPDFRELSPAPFTDPSTNLETTGNPDLKQTDITNYDLRWEYYMSPSENFSLGFFWKNLSNPIEKVFLPGTAGLLTYQNADAATLYGIEVEVLKNLDIIHPALEDFYIGSNYTWSVSNVDLTAENTLAQTSSNRALQGHSPHVFNFQIGYDNADWGTKTTLLYNIAAKRIVSVGLLGAPDKYEQPFNQLDFIASQSINEWLSIRVKMKNLLDDKVKVTQGSETTRLYTRGREFTVGVNMSF